VYVGSKGVTRFFKLIRRAAKSNFQTVLHDKDCKLGDNVTNQKKSSLEHLHRLFSLVFNGKNYLRRASVVHRVKSKAHVQVPNHRCSRSLKVSQHIQNFFQII
jgi:hypothetical protein